ncbi:MAG: hypothetical protein E6J24_16390, partial [Chloroflexi bacterium]
MGKAPFARAAIVALLAACGPVITPELSRENSAPPSQIAVASSSATPGPTTALPSPTPSARVRRPDEEEVWFTPNIGSTDMLGLFAANSEWSVARSKVTIFKFYNQQLTFSDPAQCPTCGHNLFPDLRDAGAFAALTRWGIDIGMEAGAVKEWGCTGDITASASLLAIRNVASAGGEIRYIAMDEPLEGGPRGCAQAAATTAAETARYIQLIKRERSGIQIGDIEPYPLFKVKQLEDWITLLERDGASLDFFHLDVDAAAVAAERTDVSADLRALQAFLAARRIPFGVIFTAPDQIRATSAAIYFAQTIEWIQRVKAAIGRPQHSIFQSWLVTSGKSDIPVNLPETDTAVWSHTRLINEGLDALRTASVATPPPTVAATARQTPAPVPPLIYPVFIRNFTVFHVGTLEREVPSTGVLDIAWGWGIRDAHPQWSAAAVDHRAHERERQLWLPMARGRRTARARPVHRVAARSRESHGMRRRRPNRRRDRQHGRARHRRDSSGSLSAVRFQQSVRRLGWLIAAILVVSCESRSTPPAEPSQAASTASSAPNTPVPNTSQYRIGVRVVDGKGKLFDRSTGEHF